MTYIGRILQAVREARGMTRIEVARRLGYGSTRKGMQKLTIIEATGRVRDELLVNLLDVLHLDLGCFEVLCERLYLTGVEPAIPPATVEA